MEQGLPRWALYILLVIVVGSIFSSVMLDRSTDKKVSYSTFISQVKASDVKSVTINADGSANGTYKSSFNGGGTFDTAVPTDSSGQKADIALIRSNTNLTYKPPDSGFLGTVLPLVLPLLLLIGFFVWMQRRAQGQMSGIMSIGRSRAKSYNTERPSSSFADVAGYEGVKQEIREVVDFLKEPDRFAEIGARIPKGVLLVGPPGTGKTLIARAVAGEAGVPFLSVSGSDFMEMFVGVGASRVRDLFENARKLGRAIIFVDEIDSIGRPRPAAPGPLRPPGRRAPARTGRPAQDPRCSHPPQAHDPGRRPGPGRPGHARNVGCRSVQPGQRGRPPRRAQRAQLDQQRRLRIRP
jgi:cell division protease FtsH